MGNHILENEKLRITIADRGAELISVVDRQSGRERLWQADPSIWNRHAPILFPFVGKLTDGKYRIGGQEYVMQTQHGFARDMEFVCTEKTEHFVTHVLMATEETKLSYPYDFRLTVRQGLNLNDAGKLEICWELVNLGDTEMLYAVGGHPAFLPPDGIRKEQCRILFPGKKELSYFSANPAGYALPEARYLLHLDRGSAAWQDNIPETWIFENEDVGCVGLAGPEGEPFVLVHCEQFPILAVWANPQGPFICLEPWFGRTDDAGFKGTLEEKPGMQTLAAHSKKEISWSIDFCPRCGENRLTSV